MLFRSKHPAFFRVAFPLVWPSPGTLSIQLVSPDAKIPVLRYPLQVSRFALCFSVFKVLFNGWMFGQALIFIQGRRPAWTHKPGNGVRTLFFCSVRLLLFPVTIWYHYPPILSSTFWKFLKKYFLRYIVVFIWCDVYNSIVYLYTIV